MTPKIMAVKTRTSVVKIKNTARVETKAITQNLQSNFIYLPKKLKSDAFVGLTESAKKLDGEGT